jgi:predicted outer membrane repeat protein
MMSLSSSSLNGSGTEIAFIDAGVMNADVLASQFKMGTEVHLLDSGQDAIVQITQILANRSNVSSIQILSHGSQGALQLGDKQVSDLSAYDQQLQLWGNALTADADILLYGCHVAADATGQAWVDQFSQLTGADVAASDDLTGSAALGGDWDLEYQTGEIEAIAIDPGASYENTLATFVVNSNADVVANDNVTTLREAVNQANTTAGADTIIFTTTGTITLTNGEMNLTDSLSILGSGAALLTIDGNDASRIFTIDAGVNVTLSGLTFANGFSADDGGAIDNAGNLTVQTSTFRDNVSDRDGGAINNDGQLTVTVSTFTNNTTTDGFGGALDNNEPGTMTVTGSTFTGNRALDDGDGGAIENDGRLTVTGSRFTNNEAEDDGGAIDLFGDLPVSITSSTFTGNIAGGDGGAIFSDGNGGATINFNTFNNNRAALGGAISNDDESGNAIFTGNTFTGNTAVTRGGAIDNNGAGIVTLNSNIIRNNSAPNGGGVFNEAGSTARLQANTITNNTATGVGVDLDGDFISNGFNIIGKGGGFIGIVNLVNGDVILVP